METLIFPGYSLKNKDWAYETRQNIGVNICRVIDWPHWKTGISDPDWIESQATKISNQMGNDTINIIAKSIGTAVALDLVKRKPDQVNKIILCGVPLSDLKLEDYQYYQILADTPDDRVLCFQNKSDNHGNFTEVKTFLHSINPNIQIISMPRNDHEYPYYEHFKHFLD